MENSKNSSLSKLIPVMLCFFAMGFVDLVGIASNYVKADLGLSDSQANIFPSLVFFWFLIFSVPTGMLMSRIGQQKTVLLSLIVTFASLLLPVFGDSYMLMLISFSLLGIGNALMQTSLNPLLSNIVRGDRLASSLTFGQFVKAIASFLAPYIAMWGATQAIPTFDLGWRILFPIYMIVAVIAILLLNVTQIEEEKEEGKPAINHKESSAAITNYIESVIPEYDADRVYVSDMRKMIQWYNLLLDKNLLNFDEPEEEKKEE